MVLAASGVWARPCQSRQRVLMVGVVLVTVLSMSVISAVSGGSLGYADGEVGVGGVGVGDVIGDAAGGGGAGDDSADAVSLGCAVVVLGVGGVGDSDGDAGVGGAPVVDVVGDADGEEVAGNFFSAVGAGGGAPFVRVCRVRVRDVGVSPRHSWQRVPLMLLLVGVEDVMVSLMLLVLPGMVAGDAPGDTDAAGGDVDGEGVVGG